MMRSASILASSSPRPASSHRAHGASPTDVVVLPGDKRPGAKPVSPGGVVPLDDDTIDDTVAGNVVRHHETLDALDYNTFIEPPNTGFHSEAQICGKFQQLGSSPYVASGLWKVCSETGEIDVLANSYAFGALVLTVISLVAAVTVKLLFPSVPMDEGVGDLLLQTMELSDRVGVSVPPALAQRTPRFQKMHFGSGNSEMDEAVRSRAEDAAADAAGQGTEAAADHLNDAYGDGDDPEDPEEPSDD